MSDGPTQPIRILCVDDHPIFRQGLAAVIGSDPGLELVGEAANAEDAIHCYRDLQPDVTLMDLRLPGRGGIDAIRAIRARYSEARIVVLTTETGDVLIQRALEAGAKGYALKGMAMTELLNIVRTVHAGQISIPGNVATRIARHIGEKPLTAREIEVLSLIAQGFRNKAVGEKLSISDETVKMHVSNCLTKLGARDRTHAVTIAVQRGFIDLQILSN